MKNIKTYFIFSLLIFFSAVSYGALDVADLEIKTVRQGKSLNVRSLGGDTMLHMAVSISPLNVSMEIAQILIENGADVDIRNNDDMTPLSVAVSNRKNRDHKMVVYLLENGANVNDQGPNGYTPLSWAISNQNFSIAGVLVEYGANVNVSDRYGRTPLHKAVKLGHLKMIKLLLEKSADVNAPDKYGRTPLATAKHDGVFSGAIRARIIKLLLKYGAVE